jgi:hypothetical protein
MRSVYVVIVEFNDERVEGTMEQTAMIEQQKVKSERVVRTIYHAGYMQEVGIKGRGYIEELMEDDAKCVLIDIRDNPYSRHAGWKREELAAKYGKRYRWLGETLGNPNHGGKGEMYLHKPEGLAVICGAINRGYKPIILCMCKEYEKCHRHLAVEQLAELWLSYENCDLEIVNVREWCLMRYLTSKEQEAYEMAEENWLHELFAGDEATAKKWKSVQEDLLVKEALPRRKGDLTLDSLTRMQLWYGPRDKAWQQMSIPEREKWLRMNEEQQEAKLKELGW